MRQRQLNTLPTDTVMPHFIHVLENVFPRETDLYYEEEQRRGFQKINEIRQMADTQQIGERNLTTLCQLNAGQYAHLRAESVGQVWSI